MKQTQDLAGLRSQETTVRNIHEVEGTERPWRRCVLISARFHVYAQTVIKQFGTNLWYFIYVSVLFRKRYAEAKSIIPTLRPCFLLAKFCRCIDPFRNPNNILLLPISSGTEPTIEPNFICKNLNFILNS